MVDTRRQLPSVDSLLRSDPGLRAAERFGRDVVKAATRTVLDGVRAAVRRGRRAPDEEELMARIVNLAARAVFGLAPVINATGVVLHTNLGRAPLPREAARAVARAAEGYSDLELERETGRRGKRTTRAEFLLTALTGAEDALVVNNNAAAVLLLLAALARRREVLVSRGELIEIGGEFRLPEIMQRAGCRLLEVGTTNRTHLKDYEEAIGETTALLLKVHPSNFHITGFTSEVSLSELVTLGRRRGIPVMMDMGSGALIDLTPFGLKGEPTVQEAVQTGIDLITFSGDKLLGGPQAGICVGCKSLIARLRKNTLARAVRIDKLSLAALEATLRAYLDAEKGLAAIPTLAMITCPLEQIRQRAERVREGLHARAHPSVWVTMEEQRSEVGGGALPSESLASYCVALQSSQVFPHRLEAALRRADPAVVGRIKDDKVLLDLRTVRDEEVDLLIGTVGPILAAPVEP